MAKTLPVFDADTPSEYPKPPEELAKDILYKPAITQLWGHPSSGKSHISIDLACTIAQYHSVVYVAAEAPYEIANKVSAWKHKHHTDCKGNLKIWEEPIQLLKKDSIAAFLNGIDKYKPEAVFIDPLIQCFLGGAESNNDDMNEAFVNINQMCISRHMASCVVSHTGWAGEHERGGSAQRAAVRLSFQVSRSPDGQITLKEAKRNVGLPRPNRYFRVEQVGSNEGWSVIVPTSKGDLKGKWSYKQDEILTILASEVYAEGVQRSNLFSDLSKIGISHSTAYEGINRLIQKGLATKPKYGVIAVTEQGVVEAKILVAELESGSSFQFNTDVNWQIFPKKIPVDSKADSSNIQLDSSKDSSPSFQFSSIVSPLEKGELETVMESSVTVKDTIN